MSDVPQSSRPLRRPRALAVVVTGALVGLGACTSSGRLAAPTPAPTPAATPAPTPATATAAPPRAPVPAPVPVQAPRVVAVLPLTGGAGMEGLGFAVSEILARDLALVPRVRVVERARLDAVLKELGLAATGRVAPQSVPRAGQLVSAERLLSGTVARTPAGGSPASAAAAGVSVEVALLNVQTSVTQPIYSGRFPLNGLIDAQEQLAVNAFTQLGVTLLPAERERLAKRPTRRVDALIAFGNGRRADAMGNATQAKQFYQQASRLDPAFVDPSGVLAPAPALPVATAPLAVPTVSPVVAPSTVSAAAPSSVRQPSRQPFDQLMDELALGVTDRVVRRAAPPALCPPTCPALAAASGTVTVRITP